MSAETIEWLNDNVLIGFVDDRAKWAGQGYAAVGGDGLVKPWFATDGYTGQYVGPVPIEAVSDLLGWDAIERELYIDLPCGMDEADSMSAEGVPSRRVLVEGRKAIVREDTASVLYIGSDGYKIHQYREWLVSNVATILDDDVAIDSAGLLMGGGVAWVSVSLPETVTTAADFAIRPRILAFTSHNGKHATTYMRSMQAPVCDNSLAAEMAGADASQRVRIKHTSDSEFRIGEARGTLAILHQQADDMAAFVDRLAAWDVDNKTFAAVLGQLEPMPEEQRDAAGKVTNQRALTMADDRRQAIVGLYLGDPRVAPWKGTALGVLQAYNTFDQQVRSVGNGERVERQMLNTLDGSVDRFDAKVLGTLAKVADVELRQMVGAAS